MMKRFIVRLACICFFLFAYTALVQAENNASAAGTAQLTLAPATLSAGTNATLSFDLVNSLSVTALQFDVILPEGLSVNTIINEDEEEVPAITLTDRKKSSHSLSCNRREDGRSSFL